MTDIHRVLAGDADPLGFADHLFGGLPPGAPAPPELHGHEREMGTYARNEMAPALVLALHALTVADYMNDTIRSAPFFHADAEAEIAIKMLHRLAQWLAGEHHDPIPATIATIIEEIHELLGALYNHYEDGGARDNDPPEP